jgi:hypothetical protein
LVDLLKRNPKQGLYAKDIIEMIEDISFAKMTGAA